MQKRVAVVGATGVVGRELIGCLEDTSFPLSELLLFAEDCSGETVAFGGDELDVLEMDDSSFRNVDLAFFCTPAGVSRKMCPQALREGCLCLDLSDAFRADDLCPLVVAGYNTESLVSHSGLVALPSAATIALVLTLAPFLENTGVTSLSVTVLQAVSGMGRAGIAELERQVSDLMNMRDITTETFGEQIAFNLLPWGHFVQGEGTEEEAALVSETMRIVDEENLALTVNAAFVPVFYGHSLSLTLTTEKPVTPAGARAMLVQAQGVRVIDNPRENCYPTPLTAMGGDEVVVGRVRGHAPNVLSLWVTIDNVRRGAAVNAVEVARELLAHNAQVPSRVSF